MISILRKHDFKFYVMMTVLATLANIYSIHYLTDIFGKNQFADYVYYSVITQIIFSLSDLGIKISFFSEEKNHSEINTVYLLVSKLIPSIILFFGFSFFIDNELYNSFFLIVIGTSIFPSFLLQRKGLFTIIGINNLIFRVVPLFFVFVSNNLKIFILISGLVLIINSLITIIFTLSFKEFENFTLRSWFSYFREVAITNKYLSFINLTSILEINVHVVLCKKLFGSEIYADLIQVERYVNYLKQLIIYLFDYLFPKVNLENFRSYRKLILLLSFLSLVFIVILYILYTEEHFPSFISKNIVLILLFSIYPVSILVFNFESVILHYKYGLDRHNFYILIFVFSLKVIFLYLLSTFGSFTVPLVLIISEIIAGLFKYYSLSKNKRFKSIKLFDI